MHFAWREDLIVKDAYEVVSLFIDFSLCLLALNKFMMHSEPMQAGHSYMCDTISKQILAR